VIAIPIAGKRSGAKTGCFVEEITDKLTLVLVGHQTGQQTGDTARFLCFCEETTRQKASTRKTVSDLCPGEDNPFGSENKHGMIREPRPVIKICDKKD
jgi:hypothetical protein